MMKGIIITNTLFQVMVAIQLKVTEYYDDAIDLVITDRSGADETLARRIEFEGFFENVFFINTKDFVTPGNPIIKFKNYVTSNLLPTFVLRQFDLIQGKYDLFLYHNDTVDCQVLYDRLVGYNASMCCIRFEEGYSIYIPLANRVIRGNKIRNFLGKRNLRELTEFVYLFHPELLLVDLPYPVKKIQPFNSEILAESFRRIFNISDVDIKEKFIFFGEAFSEDKEKVDDISLIKQLIEIIGRDNLLLKPHPRVSRNVYDGMGVRIRNDKAPWEAIQMCLDMNGKVLVSLSSGSILASQLYSGGETKAVLLYNLMERKPEKVDDYYVKYIEKFNKYFDSRIELPKCYEELKRALVV